MSQKELIKDYKINCILDIEKVYNDFYGYVYTIISNKAKGYLRDEDIEEIITDTFFILWKNTEILDDKKPIKSYIAGITKNLIYKKMKKNNTYIDIMEYENKIEDINVIDLIIEERENIALLESSIENLKEVDKEVFELYYYRNMKIKEIALLLNISEFNVKQKLYRIRKKIKKIMEKKGGYRYEK